MQAGVLDTIARVYDTVDGTGSWSRALGGLCATLDAHGALLALEAPGEQVVAHHQFGLDEAWVRSYARDWAFRSPYLERFYADPSLAGRFVASEQLLPYEEWLRCPMFLESCRDQDVHHSTAAAFDTVEGLKVRVSCVRDHRRGPVRREELDALDRLLPHIGQALRLRRPFPDPVAERLDALEARCTPALVVDPDGVIQACNDAAAALLAEDPRLRGRARQLSIRDPAAETELARALRECLADDRRQRQVRLPATDSSPPLALVVTRAPPRLGAVAGDARGAESGSVLVTVIRRDGPGRLPTALLRELFGLTPTEARLARCIAAGRSPDQAAATFGVGVSTVRWHLKRVFAKTAVAGQTELTALLQALAHADPALGGSQGSDRRA